MSSDVLSMAVAMAQRGMHVLPLHTPLLAGGNARCSCGIVDCRGIGKHPRTRHGIIDASAEIETIRGWWRAWPDANLGVATGAASGMIVLDIDRRHGGDRTLASLEGRYGALPATWRVATGGGQHIAFRHPGKIIRCSAGKIGPGIDVRGDGGYVVGPGSLHASGHRYRLENNDSPVDVALAEMPSWLCVLIGDYRGGASPTEQWRAMVRSTIEEGRRNDTLARLAGHLLRRRVDPYVVLHLSLSFNASNCSPPLDESEVLQIVNSIARRERQRRELEDGHGH